MSFGKKNSDSLVGKIVREKSVGERERERGRPLNRFIYSFKNLFRFSKMSQSLEAERDVRLNGISTSDRRPVKKCFTDVRRSPAAASSSSNGRGNGRS